jgi:gliding motility-associated-like protein
MKSPLQIIILRQFLALALLILLCFGTAEAQTPIIRSVTPSKGSMGETVSISGNNFGIDMSKLTVFFGANQATILSATDQLIEVTAPAGATYRNVSVTRSQLVGPGLTGYSNEQFLLSFGGTHPFNTANLEAQKDFAAESGIYDLCLCDFNGDKKIDIGTANKGSNNISILINNSSPGTVAYPPTAPATATPILVPIGSKTLHVTCGDLNGDGKPDIVATSGDPFSNNRIFILQNMGGGLFTQQTINLNIAGTQKVKIADLDLDGLPDLVVTHKNGPPSNLSLLKNLSTTAAILFDAPIDLAVTGASTSDALDIADLNGDAFPEIIIGQSISKDIFILKNIGAPGTLSFDTPTKLTVGNTLINLRIGDLDNDGKSDIAVVDAVGAVYALLNQSVGTTLGFSAPVSISTDATSWGLDFGDLDGDGKADIVVTSVANSRLTILNNESVPGTLSFLKTTVSTSNFARHVSIGDVDNDGKPDIAFTVEGASSKVAVFRNGACMIPEITPEAPIKVCQNADLKLYTTQSGGATYTWKNVTAGGTTVGTNNPSFSVPTASISTTTYSITVQQPGLTCPTTQVVVEVAAGAGSPPVFVSPTPTGPVCTGSAMSLAVTPQAGKTFTWTGPNNFTGTGTTTSISNFQAVNAGKYFVDVIDASTTCLADRASIVIEAIDAQNFTVQFSGSDLICQDDKKILQINPTSTTFTFEWYKNSVLMGGKTKDTLHVYSTGEYFAKVTVPNCGVPKQTNTQKITVASKPNVNFSFIPATAACSGQDIQFTDLTTNLDSNLDVIYKWNFDVVGGSGGTSSDKNPKHQYTTAVTKTFSIKLGVSYRDNVCYQETQSPYPQITINPAPPVVIASTNHPDFKFCKGEKIELKVSGTFTNYKWSTGDEGAGVSSIEVEEGGLYSVEVTTAECTLNDDQTVTAIEPQINISATPPLINEGQSSQLSAEGLQNYTWSPSETLSDASINNPVASPLVTTSYTVSGQDENGCTGNATVVVEVKGEPIVNKLKPFNFFSPNGDGPNEVWTIDKIQDYPQCNVIVYDQKGIKVFEAKPYNNDWDGTFHGKKLPDGVYYYIIRCDGEENKTRNGSITLLR